MVRDILRLDLAVNLVSKPLNRVEKIPNLVVVNSVNPRVSVATPEPSPTRSASPNGNPGTLGLFLFIFRVIKFSFSKMSRPESLARPEWQTRTGTRFTSTFSFILSKHFIMSFRCESGFSFGQAHNHLQIQYNSVGP